MNKNIIRTFSPRKEVRTGFTLIELLVVIAIIALLASLTIPAIQGALRRADQVGCASRLRGIGLATIQYVADHRDKMPGPIGHNQISVYNGDESALITHLAPYLGLPDEPTDHSEDVFLCPGYRRKIPESLRARSGVYFRTELIATSDGEQQDPYGYPGNPRRLGIKFSTIPNPSETWALRDVDQEGPIKGWNSPEKPVHGKTRNVLYFDGHVSAVRVGDEY